MPIQKIPKEVILGAIAKLGPCQPIDIRKEIKQGDTFLIGAMLSELVAEGVLAISKTRRGGSPFYYDLRKPEALEQISQYLNEKDRRTCAMLREQRVMREDAQEPLVRVGLQSIHDFAQRMAVDEGGKEIVWWRYFLVPEAEAKHLIGGGRLEKEPEERAAAALKAEPKQRQEKKDPKQEAQRPDVQEQERPKQREEPKVEQNKEGSKGESPRSEERKEIKLPSPAMPEERPKAEPKKRAPRAKAAAAASPQPSLNDWLIHDTLYEKVQVFAVGAKGILTHQQSIKANAELTCVLTNDGPYGRLSVMLYALNKKKVAEKDITQALLQARGQGMPLLVLSTEALPAKLTKSFETTLNVHFKGL